VDPSFPHSVGNRAEDEFSRLLERAQDGEPEAMGILLSDLRKYLLKLAEQDWPVALRRRESPSELVQQALELVIQGLPGFAGEPRQWRSWAATILQNRITQRKRFHRALRRNPALEISIHQLRNSRSGEFGMATDDSGPLSRLGKEELQFLLQQVLNSLPQQDRDILQWRIVSGLTWEAIGKLLGVTDKSAKRRFGEALRVFSAQLKTLLPTLSSHRPGDNSGI